MYKKIFIIIFFIISFLIIIFTPKPKEKLFHDEILETQRLSLKLLEERDLNEIFFYMNDEIGKNLGGKMKKPFKQNYRKEYKKNIGYKNIYDFVIREKNSNHFIGVISVYLFKDRDLNLKGKVGYWTAENQRKKGYMSETLKEVEKLYPKFFNLNKIWTTVRADNLTSLNLLIKSGFQKKSSRISNEFSDENAVEEIIFEKDLL
jgi:RimJ/RimL family protein N-acetyltransferase